MKTLIEEINAKLKAIISDLETQKSDTEGSLASVQEKIDEKIDEAKGYKSAVEEAKNTISKLEDEIKALEEDLSDLTERFKDKDLNAILETGNKEINSKIVARQKDIAKQRERINELTEKARTIKDLLINLKKDKESKKNKLNNLTNAYEYYSKELNKIIDYSTEHPDDLNENNEESSLVNDENFNFENSQVVDDKPIFDAIELFEKEDDEEEGEALQKEPTNEEDLKDASISSINFEPEKEVKEQITPDDNIDNLLSDFKLFSEKEENPAEEESNISKLFTSENSNINFKELNDNIDKAYENIFGNSNDIQIDNENNFENKSINNESENIEVKPEVDDNTSTNINIFDVNSDANVFDSVSTPEPQAQETTEEKSELDTFFKNNNLDYSLFSENAKEKLKTNFNLINYTKTLDILRKNNIKLENIYDAPDIFTIEHNELESIINKLLLAGQNTQNISYILNALSYISSKDLQDVINSYGQTIKDANITDLIIKAKHLKEIGGGK